MSEEIKPSAGAVRAAEQFAAYILGEDDFEATPYEIQAWAAIIDRETGAGEMRAMLAQCRAWMLKEQASRTVECAFLNSTLEASRELLIKYKP